MTCAPTGSALVSCQRTHWSPIPSFLKQLSSSCSVLHASPLCLTLCAHPWTFTDSLSAPSTMTPASVSDTEGGGGACRHRSYMRGMSPHVLQSRQKLCCCLGIDINWPFQSLLNSALLSSPLLPNSETAAACRMKPSRVGKVEIICVGGWRTEKGNTLMAVRGKKSIGMRLMLLPGIPMLE